MNSCAQRNTKSFVTVQPSFFAKGVDISWIKEMDLSVKKFYDSSGQQQNLI